MTTADLCNLMSGCSLVGKNRFNSLYSALHQHDYRLAGYIYENGGAVDTCDMIQFIKNDEVDCISWLVNNGFVIERNIWQLLCNEAVSAGALNFLLTFGDAVITDPIQYESALQQCYINAGKPIGPW